MPVKITRHVVYPPRPKESSPKEPKGGHGRSWTPQEDALLLKSYDPNDSAPLAAKLGRTVYACRTRLAFLRHGGMS